MFRPLISLAIAGVLAACGQQASSPGLAHAAALDTPAALAHAVAPEGWVVRNTVSSGAGNNTNTSRIVIEDGQAITEIPAVEMVFVRGNQVAMDAPGTKDL